MFLTTQSRNLINFFNVSKLDQLFDFDSLSKSIKHNYKKCYFLWSDVRVTDSGIESDFLDFEQRRVSAVEERSDDQRARGERVGSPIGLPLTSGRARTPRFIPSD